MPSKFDFVSPGIQLNEVDESVLPNEVQDVGPLLIGPALKGPGMKPVRVNNLQDFYSVFGRPQSGKGTSNADIWREGNVANPLYSHYAAQAHLASNTTPLTFVRLVGKQNGLTDTSTDIGAGWSLGRSLATGLGDMSAIDTAYGLFIVQSGALETNHTGALGAIIYSNNASLALSGTNPQGTSGIFASGLVKSVGAGEFKISISSSAGDEQKTISFNPGSSRFIRNSLNTNPQKIENNNNFGKTNEVYFVGETFEQAILDDVGGGSAAGDQYGLLIALDNGSNNYNEHFAQARAARTGWFINRNAQEPLFRLISLSEGEFINNSISIRICDLKLGNTANPLSTFTVKILEDGVVVETYAGCNLSPSSADYIGKRIGTQYLQWNSTDKKYNVRGLYPNVSNYVYVDIDNAVENQTLADTSALPVGFYGPLRHKGFSIFSGSTDFQTFGSKGVAFTAGFLAGSGSIPRVEEDGGSGMVTGLLADQSASFRFPSVRITNQNTNQGSNYPARSVFGVRHVQGTKTVKDPSYIDVLRYTPVVPENDDGTTIASSHERAFVFTIEEITASQGLYFFSENLAESNKLGLQTLINAGVKQYEAPMAGGYDGVNILKTNPFGQKQLDGITTRKASYVKETYEFALDIVEDAEVLEYDTLAIPGITDNNITNRVISICETRGDSMAVVDLAGIYKPSWENAGAESNSSLTTLISTAQTRLLDSSFAASYFPSLLLRDTAGGGNDTLFVPPSVGAIGAIAKSQGLSEPWFAPAGFNRGGINQLGGSQGPRIVGTDEHLSKANRDALYQENINPIARFPASGDIVIFGQKTLQQKKSALDRINVRRLLLFLKRRIGKVSETILFDQNVNATWNRFKAQADRILQDVQSRLGITEYKLILDETTTTADLIDRNVLYAKVLIKPARAIEYIVVDFVVTRSGIEF